MSEESGKPLWTTTYTLELRDLVRYAGASGDLNPIHYDRDFARSRGLPDVIAHGALSMGMIARLVREHAGPHEELRRLSCRFVGVVVPGSEVTVTCREVDRHADGSCALAVDLRHTGAGQSSIVSEVRMAAPARPSAGSALPIATPKP